MIKIRLSQLGKKNDHFYRVVAVDEQKKRSGAFIANLGYWHPRENVIKLDKKEIDKWVKQGAQITASVERLINKK